MGKKQFGGFGGYGGGGGNMQQLMRQAQKLQEQMPKPRGSGRADVFRSGGRRHGDRRGDRQAGNPVHQIKPECVDPDDGICCRT
jgi:hypothetical protein